MRSKKILETLHLDNVNYILVGICEIKKEKRKPTYSRGGSIPITFQNENLEQYTEHYYSNRELELLNENFSITGIIKEVIYDDNTVLPKYEGVYVSEEDYIANKKALKKLKKRNIDKALSIINNDPQFYTTVFCIVGVAAIFTFIIVLNLFR